MTISKLSNVIGQLVYPPAISFWSFLEICLKWLSGLKLNLYKSELAPVCLYLESYQGIIDVVIWEPWIFCNDLVVYDNLKSLYPWYSGWRNLKNILRKRMEETFNLNDTWLNRNWYVLWGLGLWSVMDHTFFHRNSYWGFFNLMWRLLCSSALEIWLMEEDWLTEMWWSHGVDVWSYMGQWVGFWMD